jgi:sporulation protein YlmC with PRC-barrel domain
MQSDLPPDSVPPCAGTSAASAAPSVHSLADGNALDAQVPRAADRPAHRPVLVDASALGGCAVFASDGVSVGVVTELIVDVAGRVGQIAYVLVAPKHPAAGQSESRALPWSALLFDPARHCFTLEVSAAAVRDATTSREWPIMPDEQWKADVHHYYHPTEPYTPSASQVGLHGRAPGPIEPPIPEPAQAPNGMPAEPQIEPSIAAPLEPAPDADPGGVEHDFLPELGLKSPFRRREPGPK